jgi:hypothetical protein
VRRASEVLVLAARLGVPLATSPDASGGTVAFMIDGEPVGLLECENPPHQGCLRLAGRSGFSGTSNRTGLFDNAFVELTVPGGGSWTICDDDFTLVDDSYWHSFGSPLPHVVADFGNPEPCLASGGDSASDSGVRSMEGFVWSLGFDMSVDVFVKEAYPFHSVEFGMTNERDAALGGRGHEIGMQWKGQTSWPPRTNRLFLRTDLETLELPGPALNEWHRFRIVYPPDDSVLEILVPGDGAVYDLCAPDTATWVSSVDPVEGPVLEVYSRTCGADWELLGATANTGELAWPSAPCSTGCYQLKIEHSTVPSLVDTMTFEVEGAEVPHVAITSLTGSFWGPCAPDTIRWTSNIPVEEGEVLELSWRGLDKADRHASRGPWHVIGESVNDGIEPWPDGPCCSYGPRGCEYELRIAYIPDPSVSDTVRLNLVGYGGGDGVAMFVDFSGDAGAPEEVESRVDPALYTSFSAYIGLCNFGGDAPGGFTDVSFAIGIGPGATSPPAFDNLLPGDLAIGSWETGVTLASAECVSLDPHAVVYIARMDLFSLSDDPWDITILEHPEFPRWLVDCHEPGEVHEYCIWMHGGVNKDAEHGDSSCGSGTAVQQTTWGAIKAMYH